MLRAFAASSLDTLVHIFRAQHLLCIIVFYRTAWENGRIGIRAAGGRTWFCNMMLLLEYCIRNGHHRIGTGSGVVEHQRPDFNAFPRLGVSGW